MTASGSGVSAVRQMKQNASSDSGQSGLEAVELIAHALLGRCITAKQIVEEADLDASGEVDAEEFERLCRDTLRLRLTEEEIRDAFHKCDVDQSGTWSVEEAQQLLTDASKRLEEKLVSAAWQPSREIKDERRDTKLVALVAHNNMKSSMMTFVAQHRDFFKTVQIVTTGSTGAALERKLGLTISRKVASGPLGGDQEIGGLVTQDEVAAAFFFIDPLSPHPHEADNRALTRICEVHNIATATNPHTGAALVHAFQFSQPHKQSLYKRLKRRNSEVVDAYILAQTSVITEVATGA